MVPVPQTASDKSVSNSTSSKISNSSLNGDETEEDLPNTTKTSNQSKFHGKAVGGRDGVGDGQEDHPYPKTDGAYFTYYANLGHQAQMLQDNVRTSSYQSAILGHSEKCFKNKVVMDVGAGNGILSLFAAQAGAKKVFAVEASLMVKHLEKLVEAANPVSKGIEKRKGKEGEGEEEGEIELPKNEWLGERLVPVHAKVEDVTSDHLQGHNQVDTIVSECLGVLLLHERMCESFVDARDRFLKKGGAMFPNSGTICLAPVEDKAIWDETAQKGTWWENQNFYGVDLTPFSESAWSEAFSSPIVGCFSPTTLLSTSSDYVVDFETVTQSELEKFSIPVRWEIKQTAVIHALGGWFDLSFLPPMNSNSGKEDKSISDVQMKVLNTTNSTSNRSSLSVEAPAFQPSTTTTTTNNSGSNSNISSSHNPVIDSTDSAYDVLDPFAFGLRVSEPETPSVQVPTTYMTTSPFSTPTHWQQVRFALPEPLAVNKGQVVCGEMRFEVNDERSYNIAASLKIQSKTNSGEVDPLLIRECSWRLDRQTYSWTSSGSS